jgi:hypothetical protein
MPFFLVIALVMFYLWGTDKDKKAESKTKCPTCLGSIDKQAIKCMHCGTDLNL